MRILQVIPYFVPAWDYGGPLQVCYELSKELVRRGHKVTVFTTDALNAQHRTEQREEVIAGIRVRRFRNLSNSLAYKHNIFLSPDMFLSVKEWRSFDIIHIHEYRTLQNIIAHHYAKKHGIPYLLQPHGSLPRIMTKQGLKKLYDFLWGYRLLKDASRIIATTNTEAEQYEEIGIAKDRIEVVPNGIDLAEFDNPPGRGEFRKKWGINNNEKIILYLGRIHKIKGLELLTQAFAEIAREIGNIRLVIIGPDDGYLPSLKELIGELGIEDRVLLTGPVYRRDRLKAYIDADIYALPSFYETFPISVLEACACGTPVIVTDRCGIADIIDGQAGLAIPYDKNALFKAILALLSDNKAAQDFGNKGRLLVRERFNWNRIARQLEATYGELCGHPNLDKLQRTPASL